MDTLHACKAVGISRNSPSEFCKKGLFLAFILRNKILVLKEAFAVFSQVDAQVSLSDKIGLRSEILLNKILLKGGSFGSLELTQSSVTQWLKLRAPPCEIWWSNEHLLLKKRNLCNLLVETNTEFLLKVRHSIFLANWNLKQLRSFEERILTS